MNHDRHVAMRLPNGAEVQIASDDPVQALAELPEMQSKRLYAPLAQKAVLHHHPIQPLGHSPQAFEGIHARGLDRDTRTIILRDAVANPMLLQRVHGRGPDSDPLRRAVNATLEQILYLAGTLRKYQGDCFRHLTQLRLRAVLRHPGRIAFGTACAPVGRALPSYQDAPAGAARKPLTQSIDLASDVKRARFRPE
jgi:hypothetical protein